MSNQNNVPAWIEASLFDKVVRKTVSNFKEIIDFKVYPAITPGENYATIVLRVEIEVLLLNDAKYTQFFMLKIPVNNAFQRELVNKLDLFRKESGMFLEIVPALEQLYLDAGLSIKFCAKGYELPVQEDYILLEDLSVKGFKSVKRQNGLDMEHCKGVLRKLAQWHAASAVKVEQNGMFKSLYLKGYINEDAKDFCKTMFDKSFKNLLPTIQKLNGHQEYYQQLEYLSRHFTDVFYKRNILDSNEFNVLNHGDCWLTNMMFKYDQEGKLKETYLLDLQVPRYGTPAQDLLFFIISSAQLDIKIDKFDYMIKYYHDNLIQYLTTLKYSKPLPSLKDLQSYLLKYNIWGVLSAITTLVGVLCDPTDMANLENFIGDSEEGGEFKEMLFCNDRVLQHLEVILPWLCHRGAFEA